MTALKNLTQEPQLVEAIMATICANQLYNKMYAEVVDWEHILKEAKEKAQNSFDQLNLYVSLGIIDEHQCAFASLKKFFQLVKDEFANLDVTIKSYKKDLTKLLYWRGEVKSMGYSLEHKHQQIGKAIELFLSALNAKLNEFKEAITGAAYPNTEVYYSFDF